MNAAKIATTILAAGLMCVAGTALGAEGFGPTPTGPGTQSFRLGKMQLTVLRDISFVFPNDGKTLGVDAGPDAVAAVLKAAGAPTDRIALAVDGLLVRTGNRVVVLDTGVGPKMKGALAESLKEAGVTPDQVTDVLITHSHGDHVGGLVDAAGQPAFPKAAIRMSAAEWTFMQEKVPAEVVKAIAPQVKTFTPGATVVPGVTAVALDGHTPGHVGYELVSGKARLFDIGDLAHSSIVSLAKPEFAIEFDSDKPLAKKTRRATLARLAKDQELVFAPHFPYPGVGRVVVQGDGFAWQPGVP
jgi:glyoxylase-like metal-dependent hydrolase (beta-lactamase superfamily II)